MSSNIIAVLLQFGAEVFTIHAVGQRMTFVTRPHDFKKSFFQNSNVSFPEAAMLFTVKVGKQVTMPQ